MRWTKEQYAAYLKARHLRAAPSHLRLEPRSEYEKQQDADARPVDNKAGVPKVDGPGSGLYRVSITLYISDARDRDADGAATTILDTYLDALGRFLLLDRTSLRKLAKSEQRRRGRGDNH